MAARHPRDLHRPARARRAATGAHGVRDAWAGGLRRRAVRAPAARGPVAAHRGRPRQQHRPPAGGARRARRPGRRRRRGRQPHQGHRRRRRAVHEPRPRPARDAPACRSRGWRRDRLPLAPHGSTPRTGGASSASPAGAGRPQLGLDGPARSPRSPAPPDETSRRLRLAAAVPCRGSRPRGRSRPFEVAGPLDFSHGRRARRGLLEPLADAGHHASSALSTFDTDWILVAGAARRRGAADVARRRHTSSRPPPGSPEAALMSVTAATGLPGRRRRPPGLKASGAPDLALVVNDGPDHHARRRLHRATASRPRPVTWSRQVVADGRVDAVVLNSGGANACTGAQGFHDTHRTAEQVADALGVSRRRRRRLLHRAHRRAAADGPRCSPASTPPRPALARRRRRGRRRRRS